MKQENKKRNKLIACVMCMVMLGATLFGTPWFSVLADDTTTDTESTAGQSYGAWSEQLVKNGSFEAGYVGKEVYGWHKTAMEQSGVKVDAEQYPTHVTAYCNAYTLTTVTEADGNKVAAIKKKGAGYIAATSQEIGVAGNQDYRISFDYKTYAAVHTAGGEINTNTYYGVALCIEEILNDGTTVFTAKTPYSDITNNPNWSTGTAQFKTNENTEFVIIYIWTGAQKDVESTLYIDNVIVEANNDYKVPNGTFEQVRYWKDGAREAEEMGPAGWTMTGANSVGTISGATEAHKKYFKATVVPEEGRGNVALLEGTGTYTYAMLQSSYIAVDGEHSCTIAADCKLIINKADGTPIELGNGNRAIYLNLSCYDADKNFLGEVASNQGRTTNSDWKKLTTNAMNTLSGTAYVKIGLHVTFANDFSDFSQEDLDAVKAFKLYYDNIVLDVDDKSLGYTKVSTGDYGQITSTNDYTNNYAIRKLYGGVGYEDAIQLYVAKEGGITGGVTFYSEPIEVIAGSKYAIDFDYKIEGVENESFYGADVVIRYLNASGEYIVSSTTNYGTDAGEATEIRFNNANGKANTEDWVDYTKTIFTAPTDAAKMQIGFVIGGGTAGVNPDLKQSFANISVALNTDSAHWTEYEYNKTTSDLLFKLTERGNAYNSDTNVDVLDLVMMKKYVEDATMITDENKDTVLGVADMNVNTLINYADIELLHWKLLGVDTEAEAALVQGYNFYQ